MQVRRIGILEQSKGGGAVAPDLNANNYTVVEGADPGAVTFTTSDGRLLFGMANDVGAGKVLIKPDSSISPDGGSWAGNAVGVAVKMSDHTGWDGTGAWLGFGLATTDLTNLRTLQLQSRASTTEEWAQALQKSDGFVTTSASGWTSQNLSWPEDAISPKTVPIYMGLHVTAAGLMTIHNGDPATDTWDQVEDVSYSIAIGDTYGIIIFALEGTQSFEVELQEIHWGWNGTAWPFVG